MACLHDSEIHYNASRNQRDFALAKGHIESAREWQRDMEKALKRVQRRQKFVANGFMPATPDASRHAWPSDETIARLQSDRARYLAGKA